jgi:hypothetical protein
MTSSIIAFSGTAGSGKDTAANILCAEGGYTRRSFAASLKDTLAAIFAWDRDALEGITPETRTWREQVDTWWSNRLGFVVTPRLMMQRWGTDIGRTIFHPDIWIASLERHLIQTAQQQQQQNGIIITDVRFENEANMIRSLGGRIVHIIRPNYVTATPTHVSESPICIAPNDIVIINDGSLEELSEKVKILLLR